MTGGTAYLSKRSAATWLDVSVKTIDRLRAAGELEEIRLTDVAGWPVRIPLASLEAYVERRRGERPAGARRPADERFAIPALRELRAEKARSRLAAAAGEEAAA